MDYAAASLDSVGFLLCTDCACVLAGCFTFCAAFCNKAAFSLAATAVEVSLFDKGNVLCEIVLPAKPAPKELAAAELLRDSFRKIGGVDVPIVSAPSGAAAALHVGGTDEGRKAAAKTWSFVDG